MAVTQTPRLGITDWSDSNTDPLTRAQLAADHETLDNLAAIDLQAGTLAGLGSPGVRGRYGWVTGTSKLYRDDGANWVIVNADQGVAYGNVTAQTAFGAASSNGVATTVSRSDHVHGTPADPVPAHVAAGDPHPQYALDTDLVNSPSRYTRNFLLMGA